MWLNRQADGHRAGRKGKYKYRDDDALSLLLLTSSAQHRQPPSSERPDHQVAETILCLVQLVAVDLLHLLPLLLLLHLRRLPAAEPPSLASPSSVSVAYTTPETPT